MGLDAGTPPGLSERIQQIAEKAVRNFARSGFLRDASISDGGLTIKGGFLRLLTKATGGVTLFYLGPVTPSLPDGTPQQGWIVRRADGTSVLSMFDADVSDGQVNQALGWYDRNGGIVFADDTNSGQGIARPYVPGTFHRARWADMTVSTTSGTFETLFKAEMYKQQPKITAKARASSDTAGVTGELRILVNGIPLPFVPSVAFSQVGYTFGPDAVAGAHMSTLVVEIQARVTGGVGAIRVEPVALYGCQS